MPTFGGKADIAKVRFRFRFQSELIEARRIIDQDFLADCWIGRPDHELIHEPSIIDLE
jgi:hypothetical protein